MEALVHVPRFRISCSDRPLKQALEVDADLVECAVYIAVSIPANLNDTLSHPATVELLTGLWGLIVAKSNCDLSFPLQGLLQER